MNLPQHRRSKADVSRPPGTFRLGSFLQASSATENRMMPPLQAIETADGRVKALKGATLLIGVHPSVKSPKGQLRPPPPGKSAAGMCSIPDLRSTARTDKVAPIAAI